MPSNAINQPFPIMEANYSIEIVSILTFSQRVCRNAIQRILNLRTVLEEARSVTVSQSSSHSSKCDHLWFFFHCPMRSQDLLIRAYASKHKPTAASLCPTGSPPPLLPSSPLHSLLRARSARQSCSTDLIYAHIVFPRRVPGNLRREKGWFRSFFQIFD